MDWKVIESRQNESVKLAASLGDKKARDKTGLFLAEGTTLFFDLVRQGICPEAVYLAMYAKRLIPEVEEALGDLNCKAYLLSESAFEKVSTEKGSQGIVTLFSQKALLSGICPNSSGRWVALENVQDPGNVGTVLRSAAAFGFEGVLLTGCADPYSPKAIRSSMGAVAQIPVHLFSDLAHLLDFLEKKRIRTVAAALCDGARPIGETDLSAPVCILIGNEGKGLSPEALEKAGEKSIIPISSMESLNAAVAASVYLYETARRGKE
jgi:TrmH family RNA methyltransferase